LKKVDSPRRVLVVGAGPAGLEFARVASARGHEVVALEREAEVGGHVRAYSLLPGRTEYGRIATWLAEQARGNGADRQLRIFNANRDILEVTREISDATEAALTVPA